MSGKIAHVKTVGQNDGANQVIDCKQKSLVNQGFFLLD